MGEVVVDIAPHDVLQAEAPLMGEIVAGKQTHHVAHGPRLLHGHDRGALCRVSGVHAQGHVDLGLFQQFAQGGELAYGADCYALGAPRKAPGGGEYLYYGEQGGEVVEGLAHAHEHYVGERRHGFVARLRIGGYGENLVDDFRRGEVGVIAATAGGAEVAVHAATHLRGDAEGGAVAVRDIDAFDAAPVSVVKQVFHCAVSRMACRGGGCTPYGVVGGEVFAVFLGDVHHLVERGYALCVEPVGQLLTHETGHAALTGNVGELREGEAYEGCFCSHSVVDFECKFRDF